MILRHKRQCGNIQTNGGNQNDLFDAHAYAISCHGLFPEFADEICDHKNTQCDGHHIQAGRKSLAGNFFESGCPGKNIL